MTVSAFGDFKRFSGDTATNVLNGQSLGAAAAVGTALGPRWDLEASIDGSRLTENMQTTVVTVGRQLITLASRTRNRALSFNALVRYRPGAQRHVQLGYLAGLSFVRLQRLFDVQGPDGIPEVLIPRPQELVDYAAAPIVGVDAAIALRARLSIVAAMHVSAFSLRDVSGLLLRPAVGLRWRF